MSEHYKHTRHTQACVIADALIDVLVETLEQIAKAEGRFSRDPLTHASNTIEDMQALAVAALAKARGES